MKVFQKKLGMRESDSVWELKNGLLELMEVEFDESTEDKAALVARPV